jgi:O-antigen/teichoic acid export membrane protein
VPRFGERNLARSSALPPLLKRGAWGLLDRALTSLTNFLAIVLMARTVIPDRFGEFVLALSVVQLTMSLGSALLTQPFVVLSARYRGEQYRKFFASALLLQTLFVIAVAVPVASVAGIAGLLEWRLTWLILMVIPATATWQIQEFIRHVFYTENRPGAAFVNDLVSYGGQSLGFSAAFAAGLLTPVTGLSILALTSLVAAVLGFIALRRSIEYSVTRKEFARFLTETWSFGRWTLGSAAIGAVTGFSINLLLASIAGPAAAGVLRAFVTITAPIRVLVEGARTSLIPSAAQVNETHGMVGLRAYVKRIFLLFAPPMCAYCLVAILFTRPLLDLLYGERFDAYAWLLPVVMASFFITEIFFAIDIGLRALRVTDVLFRASLFGAVANWILGPPLVYFLGLTGVAVLMLVLAPLAGIMMWRRYQRETHHVEAVKRPGEVPVHA